MALNTSAVGATSFGLDSPRTPRLSTRSRKETYEPPSCTQPANTRQHAAFDDMVSNHGLLALFTTIHHNH